MTEAVFWAEGHFRNSRKDLKHAVLEYPNFKARLATQLLEKWGMIAAVPDGEDSAGRQKMRQMTPDELVDRAMDVAEMAVDEFHRAGWIERVPDEVLKQVIPGEDEGESDD